MYFGISDTFLCLVKGSMFMVGCSMGLIEHYWYCWLDRLCIGRTMTTVLKKVVIDQLICAPGIGLWYFIGEESGQGPHETLSESHWRTSVFAAGMGLTEGRSVKDGCVEFKEKFVEYTMASTPAWAKRLLKQVRGRSGPATVQPTPSETFGVCLLCVCLLHSRQPSFANTLFDGSEN